MRRQVPGRRYGRRALGRHPRGARAPRLRRRALARVRVPVASSGPARPRYRLQGRRTRAPQDARHGRARVTSADVLRIGVAGAGNIASIAQLPTLVARDDVELRGLVTRKDDPQPLMQRWGFHRAYPTVEAMLETEELDALFVLTPQIGRASCRTRL